MKKILALIFSLFTLQVVSDETAVTIHIIGDSTVCNYKGSAYPQTGWGQVLEYFFDASRVKINNVAIGGRSSKTFIQEGRLAALKNSVKKGDFIFVQFGHNDRYFGSKAREVPIDSLPYYLNQYVDSAFAWGAIPVLVSPMNMNTGKRNIFTEYNVHGVMQNISKEKKIPFVDLTMKSYNAYNSYNADYVSRYLFKTLKAGEYPNYPDGVNDGTTHFQEMGSLGHAQMICEELESNLTNANLSSNAKSALTNLVASMKKRYTITIQTNLNNYSGLITQAQNLPAESPMTLRVTPNAEVFEKWVDDDCNEISKEKIYYGFKTKARNVTYTAMFQGGAACKTIPHDKEEIEIPKSSSSEISSSSSSVESSSSFDSKICFAGIADAKWPSPIDMSFPEMGEGTTDSNHEGFTGAGFFNIANNATSTATYKITSDQSASNARVMIRYAFAGNSNRDMKIQIDNGIYDVQFPPTGSWDKWDTTYIENVWVDALDFEMKISSTTNDGGPNIDMIAFDIAGVYRTGCEAAKVENGKTDTTKTDTTTALKNFGKTKSFAFDAKNLTLMLPAGFVNLRVMNPLGQVVFAKTESVSAGTFHWLQTVNFPRGNYWMQIVIDHRTHFLHFAR